MLAGFSWLMLFLVIGNLIQSATGVPVAGSVLGMLILLITLLISGRVSTTLIDASRSLIHYFSLLILPSSTGIFFLGAAIGSIWWKLALAVLTGTIVSVCASLLVMRAMVNWQERRTQRSEDIS
ncbi:CidA/LrgA family protein [Kushneria phosphatilytica]|uniref:CidA/LrgA family protein n=1 Tax=Kushneria phosphatilytica TaxID=657387 RepID=A0A1S1NTE5_9GAMM|nr:CidA/LrgA family protein [Kushneria phosphatilytica]OHV12849.1 hypothetical protein BH688_02120 [Kushneria phosphatilytica]QEL10702.1 CidA/LrgA family protein [Kushneria phosphatilytica]